MQHGAFEGNADIETAIDAVAADIAEIVALSIEKEPLKQRARGFDIRWITGP